MTKNEFLQGLNAELEGRVPHSVIQENIRYYDEYITQETAKGDAEEAVIETLGGPKIIARTIVDAAYDTEDRPDGYDGYGSAEENSKRQTALLAVHLQEDHGQRGMIPLRIAVISIIWTLTNGMCAWVRALWFSL